MILSHIQFTNPNVRWLTEADMSPFSVSIRQIRGESSLQRKAALSATLQKNPVSKLAWLAISSKIT